MTVDKGFLINLVLLILVGISSWVILQKGKQLPENFITTPTKPDAFVKKMEVVDVGSTGNIEHILYAAEMNHYPSDSAYAKEVTSTPSRCKTLTLTGDKADFSYPVLTMFRPDKEPVTITANKATSINNNSSIIFRDHVVLDQPSKSPNTPGDELTTNELTVCPDTKFAYIDVPFTLTKPGMTVQSSGGSVNMKTDEVDLTDPKATYDPTHAPNQTHADYP